MKYLFELISQLSKDGIPMNPCTNEDLTHLQEMIGSEKLPEAYIEFLKTMGRGTEHTFLRGHSCFMDELLILNEGGQELLEENDSTKNLTENDFVFWMSQGCMFCFFKFNEGDNPPIYFYSESTDQDDFYKITDSFTDFLLGMYTKDKNIFKKKD
ncbi:SMI1/KNR4 family protein [Paenibacillus sp. NPDC058071]|uniref:SMI1/KNR4 family protein n=1 Tax=Paenibacillus sp. NPDC058071 TaxID=3346326 RepID=UPI0036DD158C